MFEEYMIQFLMMNVATMIISAATLVIHYLPVQVTDIVIHFTIK